MSQILRLGIMIHEDPTSPWWLVCANLVDDEVTSANFWAQWMASMDIDEISGQGLILATLLQSKWSDSLKMQFDTRFGGNAKRTFYKNALYLKTLKAIDDGTRDRGVAHAWLRETGYLQRASGIKEGSIVSMQSLPVHQLELLVNREVEWTVSKLLLKLGWTEVERPPNGIAFRNDENLELKLFFEINPHWTEEMHDDLLVCISEESSGVGLLLDILSQIQLEREHLDWVRIFGSMQLLRHLISIGKWEDLVRGAQEFMVVEPLMKVYRYFVEVFPDYSGVDLQIPDKEARLHEAYFTYMKSSSLPAKLKYHLARYRAINSVSKKQISPLNYVLATRNSRAARS